MVEGAKADRRRPGSSDRALLTRLLMGKGGAGRAPAVQEGKSLAPPSPGYLARSGDWDKPAPGVSWSSLQETGLCGRACNGFCLGKGGHPRGSFQRLLTVDLAVTG